jgi:hypothetical protein
MAGVLLRKLRRFSTQPRFVQCWLTPVWLLLGLSRLLILVVPFARLAPRLGLHAGAASWVPLVSAAQQHRAQLIGRTIRLASRYTPWVSNCFPQAVAARMMLALHGIPHALYFGLAPETTPGLSGVRAHAWVAAGRVHVTGGPSFGVYTVVGMFVASPSPESAP